MSHDQHDLKVTYLRTFEVIFVVFRLMNNIIFNKTESFRGRNTSNHVCQIFHSKSNRETVYHWFFLLKITVAKIMKNLNVCSAYTIYTHVPGLMRWVGSWKKSFSIILMKWLSSMLFYQDSKFFLALIKKIKEMYKPFEFFFFLSTMTCESHLTRYKNI